MTCKSKGIIIDATAIGIQVIINFLFLICFVFLYGNIIAKQELSSQINLIVDDIMDDISKEDIQTLFPKTSITDINNVFNKIQNTINIQSQQAVKDTDTNNKDIWKKALINFSIISIIIIGIVVVIRIFGFCVDIKTAILEAIITTFFIGMVEFMLVNVTKNYISISPNQVKHLVGISIQKWIKKNT